MELDLPADVRRVHSVVIPLRWGDMDAMGHINNTLYFRYMEIAFAVVWRAGCAGQSSGYGAGDRQCVLQLHPAVGISR